MEIGRFKKITDPVRTVSLAPPTEGRKFSLSESLSWSHSMNFLAAAVRSVRLSRALQSRTLHAARSGAELRSGASSVRRDLGVKTTTAPGRLKTIDDLPELSLATNLYWMIFRGYSETAHLMQVRKSPLQAAEDLFIIFYLIHKSKMFLRRTLQSPKIHNNRENKTVNAIIVV